MNDRGYEHEYRIHFGLGSTSPHYHFFSLHFLHIGAPLLTNQLPAFIRVQSCVDCGHVGSSLD